MLQEHKERALGGILGAVGVTLVMMFFHPADPFFALIATLAVLVLGIGGCAHLAVGKGYSRIWGILWILPAIGLLCLLFARDKSNVQTDSKPFRVRGTKRGTHETNEFTVNATSHHEALKVAERSGYDVQWVEDEPRAGAER